jgi:ribosomal peptide maturation radical SAM protein 1
MPWLDPRFPSPAIGLLTATLARAGLPVRAFSFHLEAMEFFARELAADRSVAAARRMLARVGFLWGPDEAYQGVFAVPPLRPSLRRGEPDPLGALPPGQRALARRARAAAGRYLAECAAEVARAAPRVVGFSVTFTFTQLLASLALARRLKEDDPRRVIVFGGGLAGPVGIALHRAFPWVDLVVRGCADAIAVPLMADLLAGRPVRDLPGGCVRRAGRTVVLPGAPPATADLDALPVPDYDEFFARLERSWLRAELRPQVALPFEGSRGCWWADRSRCRFCGHNAVDLAFRAKSPTRVAAEVAALARRYGTRRLFATDAILAPRFARTVAPRLARRGGFELYAQVKANLTREDLRRLAAAGLRLIQPGIESLSTPVLRLMAKGVTALDNIRLLRWCAELGVTPLWNLLYGFPDEPPEEYARMAALFPALTHLPPPSAVHPMVLHRHSPYFERPTEHGLVVGRRRSDVRAFLDVDEATADELAYAFHFRRRDGRDGESYAGAVRAAAAAWQEAYATDRAALRWRRDGRRLLVIDGRRGRRVTVRLDATEARIYRACAAGARPAAIARRLGPGRAVPSAAEIRELLDALVRERLACREGERYLALALAPPGAGVRRERTP